ncbi:MAG: thioredoxin family protein [Candidatus Helarchaeota archaeon]
MSDEPNEIDEELEKIRKKKLEQMLKNQKEIAEGATQKKEVGGSVYTLNQSNFWDAIRNNEKVLIDCFADWCGPCKMIEPIFVQLAKVYKDIFFGRINVDYAPQIARHFQIQAIPLILFFRNGKLINQVLGAQSYSALDSQIRRLMR